MTDDEFKVRRFYRLDDGTVVQVTADHEHKDEVVLRDARTMETWSVNRQGFIDALGDEVEWVQPTFQTPEHKSSLDPGGVCLPSQELQTAQEFLRSYMVNVGEVPGEAPDPVTRFLDRCPACGDPDCTKSLTTDEGELVHVDGPAFRRYSGP